MLTENAILAILETCYDRAVKGLPGSHTIDELAREYEADVDAFIRWQISKCALAGFASGLGGLLTLPVAVPADVATNFYVQLRMIAVIAHMRGYDPKSDRVKSLAYACLLGNQAKEIVKDISIEVSRVVAQRLVARAAQRGFTQLGRAVPLVGGFVGGTIDGLACKAVAEVAKSIFKEPTFKDIP
jgi:hypothetical protein